MIGVVCDVVAVFAAAVAAGMAMCARENMERAREWALKAEDWQNLARGDADAAAEAMAFSQRHAITAVEHVRRAEETYGSP